MQDVKPSTFVLHRVRRLVPTAFLCATFTAVVLLTAYPWLQVSSLWLKSITLSPVGPWVDGSYWTLPIEVAFYAFVFACLLFRTGRHTLACIAVLGIVSSGYNVIAAYPISGQTLWMRDSAVSRLGFPPQACFLLVHGCFFALGSWLYSSLMQSKTILQIALLTVFTFGGLTELKTHNKAISDASGFAHSCVVPVCIWGASIIAVVVAVKSNSWIYAKISGPVSTHVRAIGVATYPLYLLHNKIGGVVIGGLHRHIGYSYALVGAVITVSALAYCVAQVFEPALQRLIRTVRRGRHHSSF